MLYSFQTNTTEKKLQENPRIIERALQSANNAQTTTITSCS